MFVAKDGNNSPALSEYFNDLAEKAEARIFDLVPFVFWIFSVFTDREDRIDGQIVSTAAQRFLDRFVNGNVELLGERVTEFIRRDLIHVQADDVHAGIDPFAIEEVGLGEV